MIGKSKQHNADSWLGNNRACALVSAKDGRRGAQALLKNASSDIGVLSLSAAGVPVDAGSADRFFFWRKHPLALKNCPTPPFHCHLGEPPDARISLEGSFRIQDAAALLAMGPHVEPKDCLLACDRDAVCRQIMLALPGLLKCYAFAQLQQFSTDEIAGILGPALEPLGLRLETVTGYRLYSPSMQRREEQEEQAKRLEEIAKAACKEERLKFLVEQQLDAQQRQVELAAEDHRIELALRAQRDEIGRREYEAECARIENALETTRLMVEKAKQELAFAAHQAETAEQLRDELPALLEKTAIGPLRTSIDALRQEVGAAIPFVSGTLASFVDGIASLSEAAGSIQADLQAVQQDLSDLREETATTMAQMAMSGTEAQKFTEQASGTRQKLDEFDRMMDQLLPILQGGRIQELYDLLNKTGNMNGWSPASILAVSKTAETFPHGSISPGQVNEAAAKARFLELLRTKTRRDVLAGRQVPHLSLDLLNRSAAPITAGNLLSSTRAAVYAEEELQSSDRFRLNIILERPGHLFIISHGRAAQEHVRILFPFVSQLLAPTDDPVLRMSQGEVIQVPDLLGGQSGFRCTDEPGAPLSARETLAVVVTQKPADFFCHNRPDDGMQALAVVSPQGDQNVPVWIDLSRFTIAEHLWTCSLIEFAVRAPQDSFADSAGHWRRT